MNASTTAPGDTMGQTEQSDAGSSEPPEPTNRGDEAAAALTLHNETLRAVDERWLRDHLAASLAHLPQPVQRVDVAIVDDARMTELHVAYHNLDETTDVLTFDATETPGGPVEVDIAVCLDVAQREAERHGHRVERELLLYIIHGLLHCMGFDDHEADGFAAMHDEEDRVLSAIGVGRTFRVGGEGAGSPGSGSAIPPLHKDISG